jgi:asparagine synthase (glutamine-hydrolysing)
MSGIGGVLTFDGTPVTRRDLERMSNALRMHGPDRAEVMLAPSIGLVHVLMRMTPEDRFDRQPMRGGSGAVITADLRLDNREDVLTRLGIDVQEALAWPDSRIVLVGWEKLGNDLWPILHGPFAVAIWDPRSRILTLARDQLGLSVVMWHRSGQFFAFATMPKGLFALPEVPRELNLEKMADFLVLNHAEHATTFYRGIFRLPPGHFMQVKPDGSVAQRRYWSPADITPVRLGSDQAYAEGLCDVLDKAVRRQMRSVHPVGCFLSGGLDSSSVTSLAARALAAKGERLAAFTQVPREGFQGVPPSGRYNDETPYVEAIRAMAGNIDVTYVRNSDCDDFADLERIFLALEAPLRNTPNLGWMLAIPRLARAQGLRVLLGGQMGNLTISWFGWSQVLEHFLRGRLITAFRQGRQFYRHSTYSRWTAFRKLLLEPVVPDRIAAWSDRRRRPHRIAPWQDHAPIRPEFAVAMGVDVRASKAGHDFLYRMQRGERATGLAMIDYLGDWHAAEKAVHGVEIRDPTADLDVIAYCFGVPPEQYLAENIDRSLIRRAMWGLLPKVVLTNRLIGYQAADWYEKLERRRGELATQVAALSSSSLVRRVLDVPRLQRALQSWPEGGWHKRQIVEEYQLSLMRGIASARFLHWIEQTNLAGAGQQAAANERMISRA